MAKSKYIDVILSLKDHMSAGIGKSVEKLQESQKTLQQYGKKFEKAGQGIQKTGRTLTKGITAPLAALGTTSVLNFGNVDKSMKLVQSTMGETKWATDDLTAAMKNSAENSVFSMQDAADAALNFARQGFDAKEAAEMLTPALSLAAGTATDLSDVTYSLGNSVKVFAKDGLTAKNAADILAKAQAQANTTTTDLFDAMSVGSSIFNTVGWSLQDLAAVTGVFGDAGITGSVGATAMKTGLARLASPAKEGEKWIKKLGIEVTNADGTMKDMVTVQGTLHDAFAGLTQEQQMQAASAIFGKNQMNKWLALINTAPETVENYRQSLDDVSGTADSMANALLSGVGGSIEQLKSTFDVAKYNIGEAMGDTVKKVIDKITDLIKKFNSLDPEMQKNIVKFAGVAAAIGPATIAFGKFVSGIGKGFKAASNFAKFIGTFPGKLSKFKTGFSKVLGIFGKNPKILLFITLAAAVAAAAYFIIKNWDKIKPVLQKVGDWFKNLGEKIKDTYNKIKEKTTEFVSKVVEKFNSIKEKAQTFFENIKGKISTFVASAKAQGGVIGSVFQNISNRVQAVKQIFDGLITFIKGVFTGNWKLAWQGVKDIFAGIFANLGAVLKAPINGVIGLINGAIGRINSISFTVPSWVPGLGGKTFGGNIPKIPYLYKGTDYFKGGPAIIHDRGAELVDLPRGARVIPHDRSLKEAYESGKRNGGGKTVKIEKFADTIIIREEADLDKLADKLSRKIENLDYTDEEDAA